MTHVTGHGDAAWTVWDERNLAMTWANKACGAIHQQQSHCSAAMTTKPIAPSYHPEMVHIIVYRSSYDNIWCAGKKYYKHTQYIQATTMHRSIDQQLQRFIVVVVIYVNNTARSVSESTRITIIFFLQNGHFGGQQFASLLAITVLENHSWKQS